jgi:hypothetical protein
MMRLHFGPIPDTAQIDLSDGWAAAKEPPAWLVQWVLSVPAAALLAFAAAVGVVHLTDISPDDMSLSGLVLVYFAMIPAHELIHALFHPDRGLSTNTVLGFWPSRLIFFAHYEGQRTKGAFMLGIIAPFLFLSVAPLAVSGVLGWTSWIAGAVIVLNAALSAVDVLGFFFIAFGVPSAATVQNKGWYTYWRFSPSDASPPMPRAAASAPCRGR